MSITTKQRKWAWYVAGALVALVWALTHQDDFTMIVVGAAVLGVVVGVGAANKEGR